MVPSYGFLKGPIVDFGREDDDPESPHFQIVVEAANVRWRVPVNVQSSDGSMVFFHVNHHFRHTIIDEVREENAGFRVRPDRKPGGTLDFVRAPLFDRFAMTALPATQPGEANDLQDILVQLVTSCKAGGGTLYALGAKFTVGSSPRPADRQFRTTAGVHDIHMNQGNPRGRFFGDNGIYQDGGLLFELGNDSWVGFFTCFATQTWYTNDQGHPVSDEAPAGPLARWEGQPQIPVLVPPVISIPLATTDWPAVMIIAALVDPSGDDPGLETVTLLNTSAASVQLGGWRLVDKNGNAEVLATQELAAGETLRIRLSGRGAQLSNKGGSLRLETAAGVQLHAVSFTRAQAQSGRTVVFDM